jgi:hypothetical protein
MKSPHRQTSRIEESNLCHPCSHLLSARWVINVRDLAESGGFLRESENLGKGVSWGTKRAIGYYRSNCDAKPVLRCRAGAATIALW